MVIDNRTGALWRAIRYGKDGFLMVRVPYAGVDGSPQPLPTEATPREWFKEMPPASPR